MSILSVKNVNKSYALQGGFFADAEKRVQALQNVSFAIEDGDCLGLVGESGSGKSTLTRIILGQDIYDSGNMHYSPLGIDPCACQKKELQKYRNEVKLIFQDPSRSLNPRVKIEKQFITSLWHSNKGLNFTKLERYNFFYEESRKMLKRIGLPENAMNRYPSYFSGGQRQRIAIVRALIHKPKLLICDEITASLDVSTHRSLLELLVELKKELHFTTIFVAHDIALVFYFCNKIAVMDSGKIVEIGNSSEIIKQPKSDVTKQLLDATPTFKY